MSMQLASKARAAGWVVSPRQIFEEKTPERLALVAVAAGGQGEGADEAGEAGGEAPWTPVMLAMGEDALRPRFAQWTVLGAPADLGTDVLEAGIAALLATHGMLRARVLTGEAGPVLAVPDPEPVPAPEEPGLEEPGPGAGTGAPGTYPRVVRVDALHVPDAELDAVAARAADEAAGGLDPAAGVMLRAVWVDAGAGRTGRLALVAHHLVIDGVSWRVLAADLRAACEAVAAGRRPAPVAAGTPFPVWARELRRAARGPVRRAELDGWRALLSGAERGPVVGARPLDPARDTVRTLARREWTVPADRTATLVGGAAALFHCGVHELLLATLAGAVAGWRPAAGAAGGVLVEVETHGREPLSAAMDLSRTVGWFTAAHPVRLDAAGLDLADAAAGGPAAGALVKRVKEQVQAVPGDGLGYGLLRHLNPETAAVLAALPVPEIGFNYLGRFAAETGGGPVAPWETAGATAVGGAADPGMPALHPIDAGAVVADTADGPVLTLTLSWPSTLLDAADAERLGRAWLGLLDGLAAHTEDPAAGGHTPSDFPLLDLDQADVDELEAEFADDHL
jgi:non-ribosomal peptide synthase protein (TIGR01720 family)